MLNRVFNKKDKNKRLSLKVKINKNKLIKNCKLALILLIALTMSLEAVSSCIAYTKATSYSDDLGTAKGIGSPILNENFTIENWNKWEMVCWGVFLSNFCLPLVDDYSSAFQANGTGSNGAGYQALAFGTGNDANNNQVIQDLCSYAISQQKAVPKEVYVTYSKLEGTKIVDTVDPNNCDGTDFIRLATFQDLFFGDTNKNLTSHNQIKNETSNIKTEAYLNKSSNFKWSGTVDHSYVMANAYLPTFWIKKSGTDDNYVKIFDFTNSWDIQIASALFSSVAAKDENITNQFTTNFSNNWSSNSTINLDCFGNIVTYDNKMIIPGSANQNLTKTRKINLLNSFILNNSTVNSTGESLVQYSSQYDDPSIAGGTVDNHPALSGQSSKLNDGASFLYYDIDSILFKEPSLNYGQALSELFNQDISNKVHDYPLHLEVIRKLNGRFFWEKPVDISGVDGYPLSASQLASHSISNQLSNSGDAEILSTYTDLLGNKVDIIGNPVAVPVNINVSNKSSSEESISRGIANMLYKMYSGEVQDTTHGVVDTATLRNQLSFVETTDEFDDYLDSVNVWEHYKSYKSLDKDTKYNPINNVTELWSTSKISRNSARIILVYPTSSVMNAVASILGLRTGSEFNTYSPCIYMTYLDWYGITSTTNLTGDVANTSDFNTDIFDESAEILKVDPSELTTIKSKAEMEDEVLRYAYLMLSPEAGRSYRTAIVNTALSDWMYEHYQKICYGTSAGNNGVSAKNNSGFLNTPGVADNPFLSWMVDKYANIATTTILILIILSIVIGLLNGRKLTWYVATIFTIVNTLLLLPSMGDMVPYVSNKVTQSMFSNRMTFWSVSEAISNAQIEKDAVTKTGELGNLSQEEAEQIMYLVKNLNSLNLDKALMIKKDISSKIIQKVDESFSDVQSLQSARWLLPLIMRQYSDDVDNNDYLYTSLSDLFDDLSNMYWYYISTDAVNVNSVSPTMTSGDTNAVTFESTEGMNIEEFYNTVPSIYPDYKDTSQSDSITEIKFKSKSYEMVTNPYEMVHRYSYLLKDTSLYSFDDYLNRNQFNNDINYNDYLKQSRAAYSEEARTSSNTFIAKATDIMSIGNSYNRTDRSTLNQEYGFLWTTETPTHYFYQNIKESFTSTTSFGKAIGDIQGKITKDKSGVEQRDSFMFATEEYNGNTYATGYTRDVLDLEELFTNVIPYIYEVMLVTGGTDGDHGVLTTSIVNQYGQVEEVPLLINDTYWEYEGINQSWLFRSNWVTKIVECPEYTKSTTVYDRDGNRYTVNNPLSPDSYPINRPMVFSEAQMKAYGLEEADLNIVELKCVKTNKEVVNRWTLMLNYAGTGGMTLEILERQMAIDSTMAFCEIFSPSGVFNTSFKMYPTSLDLRNISFDSIMRMLMLNISKDTSYIYGDTMLRVIENADIFTGAMLLIVAAICSYIIPLLKLAMTAALTLLGFISLLQNVTASTKYKYKVTCSCFLCNIIFLVLTLVYYSIFSIMLSTTSSDDVLTMSSVHLESQNPMGCLVIILIVSIAYIILMLSELSFVVRNSSDMGAEILFYQLGQVKSAVTTAAKNAGTSFNRAFRKDNGEYTGKSSGSSSVSSKHAGNGTKQRYADDDFEEEYTTSKSRKHKSSEQYEEREEIKTNSAYSTESTEQTTKNNYKSINEEINRGAKMTETNTYSENSQTDNFTRAENKREIHQENNKTIINSEDVMDYEETSSFTEDGNIYNK